MSTPASSSSEVNDVGGKATPVAVPISSDFPEADRRRLMRIIGNRTPSASGSPRLPLRASRNQDIKTGVSPSPTIFDHSKPPPAYSDCKDARKQVPPAVPQSSVTPIPRTPPRRLSSSPGVASVATSVPSRSSASSSTENATTQSMAISLTKTPNPSMETPEKQPRFLKVSELPPSEDLIARLRCCSCKTFPPPPFRVCRDGHQACGACVEKYVQCPNFEPISVRACGQKFGIMNLKFYDYVFLHSKLKCPYSKTGGCNETPLGIELKKHMKECSFRPVIKCPFMGCSVEYLSFLQYGDHLITLHNAPVYETPKHNVELPYYGPTERFYPQYVAAVFKIFGLEFAVFVQEEVGEMKMWMASMNNPEVVGQRVFASKFTVSHQSSTYRLQWSGEVHPRDKPIDSIISNDEFFAFGKRSLKSKYIFSDDQRKFYIVHIETMERKDVQEVRHECDEKELNEGKDKNMTDDEKSDSDDDGVTVVGCIPNNTA